MLYCILIFCERMSSPSGAAYGTRTRTICLEGRSATITPIRHLVVSCIPTQPTKVLTRRLYRPARIVLCPQTIEQDHLGRSLATGDRFLTRYLPNLYNENPEILRFYHDIYGRWRPHTTLPIKEQPRQPLVLRKLANTYLDCYKLPFITFFLAGFTVCRLLELQLLVLVSQFHLRFH